MPFESLIRRAAGLRILLLAFNALVVFLPAAGVLFLDTYEHQLLADQERAMVAQGRVLAAALSGRGELRRADGLRLRAHPRLWARGSDLGAAGARRDRNAAGPRRGRLAAPRNLRRLIDRPRRAPARGHQIGPDYRLPPGSMRW